MENDIYENINELNNISLKIKEMKDEVLDLYKTNNKNKCKKLLLEMADAEKDIDSLKEHFNNFLNSDEVY